MRACRRIVHAFHYVCTYAWAAVRISGLVPILLSRGIGAEMQRPLAVVVVFGLCSSTLLTLFVIPAIYEWFSPRLAEDRGNQRRKRE